MVSRDVNGLIVRPSLPALTDTYNIYVVYGQSNSNGTSALRSVSTSDTTFGAIRQFGADGRSRRDGTHSWCDLNANAGTYHFSNTPAGIQNEPFSVYLRETVAYKALQIVNDREVSRNNRRHQGHVTLHGHTALTYAQLAKGTNRYTDLINGVTRLYNLLVAEGKTNIVIRGLIWVHGEAAFASSGSGYAANLLTLYNDTNTDFKVITGQVSDIPMFITQQSNFSVSGYAGSIAYPVLDQLQAHIDNPGKIILAGPMYSGATIGSGNLHYYGHQTTRWAAPVGHAISKVNVDGGTWEPIRPRTVTRNSNIVDIEFYVPSGSLVLDTTYVTNTADGFYGFDFVQTGGSTTLTSVTLLNSTTVRFTLSGAPNGTSPRIRAGRNPNGAAATAGPTTGARTCLRDQQDTLPEFCNWCVHFDQAV
jgi:hypothetical protein